MKIRALFAFFIALLVCVTAKAGDIKRPDSYNYQRGCEAVSNGEYEEGMRYLQLELKDNPKNGYAWSWIISIHMNKREFGDAVDAGQMALKLLPKKDSYYIGFVHKSLSRVYYYMDDKDKALSEISLAIKADPKEMDYVAMRADLYYYEKEYDKANADFEKLISNNPGQPTGYMGIGRNLQLVRVLQFEGLCQRRHSLFVLIGPVVEPVYESLRFRQSTVSYKTYPDML